MGLDKSARSWQTAGVSCQDRERKPGSSDAQEQGKLMSTLVQEQFGKNAAGYLTSKPHAQGKSLDRLIALTQPQRGWRVLDVATGGGHVAYAFAPHVERVWATDITAEMIDLVRGEAAKKGLANLRTAYAKAEALSFDDASFDLVTCRIAPHHFDSIPLFVAEVHRVLKPGGLFGLVDNVVVPGSVGDFVNAFERFRDPSHLRAWTMPEWREALTRQGFAIAHEEELDKTMEFKPWAARHDATMQAFLRAMLARADADAKASLDPQGSGDALTFRLREGLFIARKA
jgi:ubiquinone/menaquinone biosynthesis C-methylase UbiE